MISRSDLKALTEREGHPESPVLSVYLDVNQSKASNLNRGFETALKHRLRTIEQQLETPEQKAEFKKDAQQVLDFVADYSPKGRTVVIFCDRSEDFFWHWEAHVPIGNGVHWIQRPYVRPLAEAFDEYERYGVILTDKAQARLFIVFLEQIEEHQEAFAEASVRHIKNTGSDHGWSQMNIQRKADEHARWHLKNVSDLIGDLAARYELDRLVLAGPTVVTSELFSLLPKRLRQRVVDIVALPVEAKPHEVLRETLAIEEKVERAVEVEMVEELVTASAKNERAVLGVSPTLEAVQEGRIWKLLYADGSDLHGSECRQCQVLFPEGKKRCPYCKGLLSKVEDLPERLVSMVLNTGGRAELVREQAARQLSENGGVGAFLRY